MSLHIETEHAGKAASITVTGDVTIQTSPELRNELQPLFTSDVEVIRVVLNDVKFMDSSGIATLVEGLQWSKRVKGRFVLSGLSETVRDVFELAKLDTIFEIEG
ncbi:MAG TPA: anti-sigma factor antagonist [Ghiorsea sp.]|nr:anti-sigma factor antagonist [Ghiorsea sp.]HIP07138.1 anti-sigma factor antagonist [Mariprofundaceae bacterium]